MVTSHGGVTPLETRGSVSFGPLKIDCKESFFPVIPEPLDKLGLPCPDPRFERDQCCSREGGVCFAIRQHVRNGSQWSRARLIWGDFKEVIQERKGFTKTWLTSTVEFHVDCDTKPTVS